jgi:hypothetical protein
MQSLKIIKPNEFDPSKIVISDLIQSKFSEDEICGFLQYDTTDKLFFKIIEPIDIKCIKLFKDDKNFLFLQIMFSNNNKGSAEIFEKILLPFDEFNNSSIQKKKFRCKNGSFISKLDYLPVVQSNIITTKSTNYNELNIVEQITLDELEKLIHSKNNHVEHIMNCNIGIDMHFSTNDTPVFDTTFFLINEHTKNKPIQININSIDELHDYLFNLSKNNISLRLLIEFSRFWVSKSNKTCGYNIKCRQICIMHS